MGVSGAGGKKRARGVIAIGIKVLISVALMAFLFARVPFHDVRLTLAAADARWLIAAGALLFASNLLGSYQWGALLDAVEIRLPFWKVCAYYHVGLFFNNFLPANIGGDIARVVDASRAGPSKAAAVSTVLMDRLIGTVALAGLALVCTLPAIDRFHLRVAYLALVAFFVLSVTLVWAVFHPRALPALEGVLGRVGLGSLKPHLDDLATRLATFRDQRGLAVRLVCVALVIQVSRIFVHVLVAQAIGIHLPLTYFFLFVPLLAVVVSLPISLNGIGLREGAGIVLFGLVGVDRTRAFSLQFSTYLVAVAVSLIGGLVFLARIPHRRAEARKLGRSA